MTDGFRKAALAATALAVVGCPSTQKEAPPPPEAPEVASAAPHALGALAAGTEAAPRGLAMAGSDGDDDSGGSPPPDEGPPTGVPDAGALPPGDIPL